MYFKTEEGEVVKWVFPFCKWAERAKIPVSWVTDLELEKDPDIAADLGKCTSWRFKFWTQNMHEIIGNHIPLLKFWQMSGVDGRASC